MKRLNIWPTLLASLLVAHCGQSLPDQNEDNSDLAASWRWPTARFAADSQFYVDPYSYAAQDAAAMKRSNDPNAKYVDYIARQGSAVWLTGGYAGGTVRSVVDNAARQGTWPVFVAYSIPYRDCGLHSAGGLDAANYGPWISDIANAIGDRKAIVIMEPDALPGLVQRENGRDCLSAELRRERVSLIQKGIQTLKSKPNIKVYVDAGHAAWLSVDTAVDLLNQVNVQAADGFALNVSNYQTTERNAAYGQQIRSRIGKPFVIDTSRNGTDPQGSTEWCNPRGRSLGRAPTFQTGMNGVDAFLWGKRPGESDGACNGGPAAGQWFRELAIELARNANLGI